MIRHIALFNWKVGTTADDVAAISTALDRMRGQIPELAVYQHGPAVGLSEVSADYAVVADVADEAAWQLYATHPAHRDVVENVMRPHIESAVRIQLES